MICLPSIRGVLLSMLCLSLSALLPAPSSAGGNFPDFSAPAPLNTNASFDTGTDYGVHFASDGAGVWVASWIVEESGADTDIFFTRSTDNGQTWAPPAPLNTNAATDSGSDFGARITTDRNGNWVAVWDSRDSLGGTIGDDSDILFARSSDNGATWTAPAPLNSNAATDHPDSRDSQPDLSTDGAGTWIAVWGAQVLSGEIRDRDVLFARSTNNGATWSSIALLNSNGATDGQSEEDDAPVITNDGLGNWLVVWHSDGGLGGTLGDERDILFARSADGGLSWSTTAPLNSDAATDGADVDEFPAIAMDGAGNCIATWRSTINRKGSLVSDVVYSHSSDRGATWTSPALLTVIDSADDSDVEVAMDRDGKAVAVWRTQAPDDTDVQFARSSDGGATWGEPAALQCNAANDSGDDAAPEIATDGAGNWIAAWDSRSTLGGTIGEDSDILFSRAQAPVFGAPAPLNSNAPVDVYDENGVELTSDGKGIWLAVWTSQDDSTDADIFFARSTDNGATWTPPAPLNTNAATDSGSHYDPQITTDGAGNWVAVWESADSLGGTIGTDLDILFARSSDNGANWTSPAPLNSNAAIDSGFDADPQLSTDGAGTWVAVWWSDDTLGDTIGGERDILFARSTNNGATWTPPAPLNSDAAADGGDDSFPGLATDGAGNWVAVWMGRGKISSRFDLLTARSSDNGATWTAPAPLNSNFATDRGDNYSPTVTTDGDGIWIAAWQSLDSLGGTIGRDSDILFARSGDFGATWSAPAPLNSYAATDEGFDEDVQVAHDGAGNWIAAWFSSDSLGGTIGTDGDIRFARSTDNGATWTAAAPLNSNAASDTGRDSEPQLATDGAGTWIAAWNSRDSLGGTIGADGDILFVRMPAITQAPGFSGPAPLNTNAAIDSVDDSNPQIATDDEGNWVAVWHSTDSLGNTIGTDLDILVARSTNRGQTWTAPAPLNTDAATDISGDSVSWIATDGEGTWIAAWQSSNGAFGSDLDILLARSTDNGATWSAPAPLTDTAVTDDTYDGAIKIISIGMGDWIAVWEFSDFLGGSLGTDFDLIFARSTDNGITWTTPVPLNANATTDSGDDYEAQLAIGEMGSLIVVWESNDSLSDTIGTDTDILFARSDDNGATWSDPAPVNGDATTDTGSDGSPHLATDGAGNLFAVWGSNSLPGGQVAADFDIRIARSTDNGSTWSAPAWLNASAYSDSRNDGGARISTDGAGLWTVVWSSSESFRGTIGTDTDILLAQSTNNGAIWSAPFTLNSNAALDSGDDEAPRIATDRAGNWLVLWGSRDPLCSSIGTDRDILIATGFRAVLLNSGNGFTLY